MPLNKVEPHMLTFEPALQIDMVDAKKQLADTAITPESYPGNALQKVQSAINDAIAQRRIVRFSKMYNITGLGTIDLTTTGSRINLTLLGSGGGIIKYDAGKIFTAETIDNSDIVSQSMVYLSSQGAGTIVWDCNFLINVKTIQDSYRDVDQIANADNRWLQGFRMINSTCVGGNGWAVSMRYSMDCTFDNNVIEFRDSFIRNKYNGVALFNSDNQNLRITDNVIESLVGSAMYLGSSFACKVHGNYFEGNQGLGSAIDAGGVGVNAIANIDFSANDYLYSHIGLSINDNGIQMLSAQNTNNTPAIKWGFLYYDVTSTSNVSTGRLHSANTGMNGKIISKGDVSMTDSLIDNPTVIRKL